MGGAAGRPPGVTPEGYRISTQVDDVDLDRVATFLHDEAYWAEGRSRDVVERSIEASVVLTAVHPDDGMVAFARVVTDRATFGWIADVFVVPAHRGRGLAHALVQAIVDDPELGAMKRLLLATADAHGVYADLGFVSLAQPERWMERQGPGR